MSQNLRSQLLDFLLNLPEIQQMSAPDWQAFFLGQIGLDRRLYVQINWSGSSQAVINDLLEHIVAEGKESMLCFCQKFDDERICGSDRRASIRQLSLAIRQLSEREWEQDFAMRRHEASLGAGSQALTRQDYSQALALLKRAVRDIPSSERRLAAKARYLLALALLGGSLPRGTSITVREKIEDLLRAALMLEQHRWAYIFTLACIKRDIYQVVPSSSQREEVLYWEKQLKSLKRTAYDDELLVFLKSCQPNLYQ